MAKKLYPMTYVHMMAKRLDEVVGVELREDILKDCKDLTFKTSKIKRAKAMKDVMEKMESKLSSEDIIKVREACACKPAGFAKKLKEIKSLTKDPVERLSRLEDSGFAGNIVKIPTGLRIEFRLDTCVCGMVSKTKEELPLSWCECCKGHVRWLYESLLDKELDVTLLESLIAGNDDCIFEIRKE